MTDPAEKRPNQVLNQLNQLAREQRRPAAEIYTLYALERVLDRLGHTRYRDDFVLKGGVLLAAYRLRRPTSDIDMQAVDFTLDVDHMRAVIIAISDVDTSDGLDIDPDSITTQQIRDDDEYTGLRVVVKEARVHGRRLPAGVKLDISTGDPIWPAPTTVELPGLLGGTVTVTGHPLPTVIAEKTVTVLQRGTQSTRWRDLVDVRSLAQRYRFTAGDLRAAGRAVATHRGVELGSLADVTVGYGAVGQRRWVAWLKKYGVESSTLPDLDDQVADITRFIDPVYTGAVPDRSEWDPATSTWVEPTT